MSAVAHTKAVDKKKAVFLKEKKTLIDQLIDEYLIESDDVQAKRLYYKINQQTDIYFATYHDNLLNSYKDSAMKKRATDLIQSYMQSQKGLFRSPTKIHAYDDKSLIVVKRISIEAPYRSTTSELWIDRYIRMRHAATKIAKRGIALDTDKITETAKSILYGLLQRLHDETLMDEKTKDMVIRDIKRIRKIYGLDKEYVERATALGHYVDKKGDARLESFGDIYGDDADSQFINDYIDYYSPSYSNGFHSEPKEGFVSASTKIKGSATSKAVDMSQYGEWLNYGQYDYFGNDINQHYPLSPAQFQNIGYGALEYDVYMGLIGIIGVICGLIAIVIVVFAVFIYCIITTKNIKNNNNQSDLYVDSV